MSPWYHMYYFHCIFSIKFHKINGLLKNCCVCYLHCVFQLKYTHRQKETWKKDMFFNPSMLYILEVGVICKREIQQLWEDQKSVWGKKEKCMRIHSYEQLQNKFINDKQYYSIIMTNYNCNISRYYLWCKFFVCCVLITNLDYTLI